MDEYFRPKPKFPSVQSGVQPLQYSPHTNEVLYSYPLPNTARMAIYERPIVPVSTNQHPPMVPYLDANRELNPKGFYGFDPSGQYNGKFTILDQIHNSTEKQYPKSGLSSNAMDANWGGAYFTHEKMVKENIEDDKATNQAKLSILPKIPLPSTKAPTPSSSLVTPSPVTPSDSLNTVDSLDNPMNPNWKGVAYSEQSVESGKYKGNEVFMKPGE